MHVNGTNLKKLLPIIIHMLKIDHYGVLFLNMYHIIIIAPVSIITRINIHIIWSTAKDLLINIEFPQTAFGEDYKHSIP